MRCLFDFSVSYIHEIEYILIDWYGDAIQLGYLMIIWWLNCLLKIYNVQKNSVTNIPMQ